MHIGDMEIISYVIEGALAHQDSMGNGSIIKPGEIQVMSAGSGVAHSEFNHSETVPVHFLQIWIIPNKINLKPSYHQATIQKTNNQLILIASQHKKENAVTLHQDVNLYAAFLKEEAILDYPLKTQRMTWIQLIKGKIKLNNQELSAGDGAAIQDEDIHIQCLDDAELLLFDLQEDKE